MVHKFKVVSWDRLVHSQTVNFLKSDGGSRSPISLTTFEVGFRCQNPTPHGRQTTFHDVID